MKNLKKLGLVSILVLGLSQGPRSYAQSIRINLNGKNLPISKELGSPVNRQGNVLVPLRLVTENLGFKVDWDQESKEALLTKNDLSIRLGTNGDNPLVNNVEHELKVKPALIQGKIYVPIRFIGEIAGQHVDYNNQTVYISNQPLKFSKNPVVHTSQNVKVGSRNIKANIISIDPSDPRLRMEMALANDKANTVEAFSSIIRRKAPLVAANGYFFDSYSGKNSTNGYIKNNFKELHYEALPSAFIIDRDNQLHMESPDYFSGGKENIKHAISVLPQLVKDSKSLAKTSKDMGHGKGFTKAPRTAIGIGQDNKIKLVTASGLTNPELAELMLNLGCREAGNLDGGASSALYYKGKTITKPGRKLNNLILFYLD